jgi:hypothetical protein
MARPTKLTRVRHARIVELLRDGVPFATACREVGISASAGYDWLYRGWGTHPDRPPAARYVAFARAVDAVWPGGFVARHEDEDEFPQFPQPKTGFVDAQNSEGTETEFREFRGSNKGFVDGQHRCETGEAAGFSEFPESGEGFAEVAEPDEIRHEKRTRARKEAVEEPRRAPMPWLSQRSRGEFSILDIEF